MLTVYPMGNSTWKLNILIRGLFNVLKLTMQKGFKFGNSIKGMGQREPDASTSSIEDDGSPWQNSSPGTPSHSGLFIYSLTTDALLIN